MRNQSRYFVMCEVNRRHAQLAIPNQDQLLNQPQAAQAPPRCTKCNSPPINGQCTNHRIAANGPLLLGFNVPTK